MLSSSLVVVVVAGSLATIARPMRSVRLTLVASDVVGVTAVVRLAQSPGEIFAEPNVIGAR